MSKDTCAEKKVNPLHPLPLRSVRAGGGEVPLPCLYSNNCIEDTSADGQEKLDTVLNLCNLLSPYHKRQAHTLHSNVHRLVTKVAPSTGHIGFLTITTPDNVTDSKEFQARFHSFLTNFLSPHPDFGEWVNTKEVQQRGAWHCHMIVVLSQEIREGVNFEEIEQRRYSSASPYLRRLWKELREAMPLYGLGRPELLPIKSNADGIARYVGKYISKHIGNRTEEQKGVRLVSYSKGWLRNGCQFAWNTKGAAEWRRKLALFAERHGCTEFYQLSAKLGAGWAYRFAQDIMEIDKTIMEEKVNAKAEGRTITRPGYEDQTIKRAKDRKETREKRLMKRIEIHTKRPVNIEEKRKVEVAKQGAKKWVQGQFGRAVTEEKEISGMTTVINGKLIIRTGERAGEELF